MRNGIPRMIAILAAVMLAVYAGWEITEHLLFRDDPGSAGRGAFYLVRGMSTGVLMAILAAWLMARYRRSFEERLRTQGEEADRLRRYYENILRDAGEAIIVLDRDGRIRSWNRAAEEIYGYTAKEIIGRSASVLVPKDLPPTEPARLNALRGAAGCIRNQETRRLRKDGSSILVRITRSCLWNPQGRLVGFTAIVSDITAEQEMKSRLVQSEKLAAIGQAAAGIAHEVRNALGGISGAVQVLKRTAAWRELPDDFGGEVERQVDRIARIVNDLLLYAHPGALRMQPASLHSLLDHVLDGRPLTEGGQPLQVEKAYGAGDARVEVDPVWMERAFTHLVANSAQAMSRGGRLRVSTAQQNGSIRVCFEDTGPGMSEAVRARALEPFFTTRARGTGLGLPIVRTIVEAHKGSMHLESRPGDGTSVTLTLPAALAAEEEEHECTTGDLSATSA